MQGKVFCSRHFEACLRYIVCALFSIFSSQVYTMIKGGLVKNSWKFVFMILSTIVLFSQPSFAQQKTSTCGDSPAVCSATPARMALYLDFQEEISELIETNPFETVVGAISKGEGGIFTNELLQLSGIQNFDDSLAGQSLKLAYIANTRSALSLLTSIYLFELSAITTVQDVTLGLWILLHDRPIVRDWMKLLDIERNLSKTLYYLGKTENIMRTISQTEKLRNLLKTYEEKGLFVQTANFPSQIKYLDLLKMLISLNIAMKDFLAYNSVDPLRKFSTHQIKFNEKWINQLDDDYHCVRWDLWFKCNVKFKNLTKDLKGLVTSTKNQWEWSWELIKQSRHELKQALWNLPKGIKENIRGKSSDSYLTEREKELLRNVYGLDTTRMTKDEAYSIISLWEKTKSQRKELAKTSKNTWKTGIKSASSAIQSLKDKSVRWKRKSASKEKPTPAAKYFNDLIAAPIYYNNKTLVWVKRQFGRSPESIEEELEVSNKIPEPINRDFNMLMIKNLQDLSNSRQEAEQLSDIANNFALTYQFWELSNLIKILMNTIGNKEKNLRKTINTLCTYQCKNKWSVGCYVQ